MPGARTAPPAGAPAPAPASAAAPVWPAPAATPVWPASTPVPSTPAESIFSRASIADLEERLTGRVLAWVGGIALIAGAILFLSLAFSRGWIGPEARVILGLAGGGVALGLGAWLFEESRQRGLAHVLAAVGLGVISVALIAATRLYELIPAELGLAGSLLTAVVAAAIAVRANSQTVAGFGLIAVLAAPPLMGASPNLVTIGFLATALVGTTVIALFRSWAYLPAHRLHPQRAPARQLAGRSRDAGRAWAWRSWPSTGRSTRSPQPARRSFAGRGPCARPRRRWSSPTPRSSSRPGSPCWTGHLEV